MKFLIKILITGLAVLVCDLIQPGVHVSGFAWAIVIALVLAFLNAVVKPILVVLTIPATLITFGVFLMVINAIIILLADWIIEAEFQVDSFWWALLFSLLLSFTTSVFEGFNKDKDSKQDNSISG